MAAETVQPTTIDAITTMVPRAYALLAGLQLDLFTALRDGPLSAEALAERVGGEPHRLSSLLYYLAAIGLLTISAGRFANTPEADRYLVRGRPGSWVEGADLTAELWSAYAQTAASIRAGRGVAAHDFRAMSPQSLATVVQGLDAFARALGERLAGSFDFSRCRTLVDAGGGSGALALALVEHHPHIRAVVADLPAVIEIAEQYIAAAGAADHVGTVAIDLLRQPLPGRYDVAVLCRVIQVLGPADARIVLHRVGDAVTPGGTLYIVGAAVDDSRLAPPYGVRFNFSAISFYEAGRAYSESEFREWLAEAGFRDVAFHWDADIITARKPA